MLRLVSGFGGPLSATFLHSLLDVGTLWPIDCRRMRDRCKILSWKHGRLGFLWVFSKGLRTWECFWGYCFTHLQTIKWRLGLASCAFVGFRWSAEKWQATLQLRKSLLVLVLSNLGNMYYLATIFIRWGRVNQFRPVCDCSAGCGSKKGTPKRPIGKR